MKVLVLCEFSGRVRNAFLAKGHDAISCDLLPTESPGPHIQGDCRDYDWSGYDLVIAHPPCTYLSNAGNRAMKADKTGQRKIKRFEAFDFFMWCYYLPAKKVCVENPIGYINSHFENYKQIIQPYFFGDREMKTTCLWLRGLPPLIHAQENELFFSKTHTEKPAPKYQHENGKSKGKNVYYTESLSGNSKKRSKTFPGIARAMAAQWG